MPPVNSHITLTESETRRIRGGLRTLRDLEGRRPARHKLTNLANQMNAILARAERRSRRNDTKNN